MKSRFLIAALMLCAAFPAFAQSEPNKAEARAATKGAVVINLEQKKVVKDANGAERLVDASSVKPGDVIEYRATYKNTSAQPVKQLVADLPIPEGLEYQSKTARPAGANVIAATKTGEHGPEPLMRTLADGKRQAVPYNEYRDMSWKIGQLNSGASVVVSARAKVEAVVPKSPASSAAAVPGTRASPVVVH
ncbi:DUF11 domain-containing protein [Burkholderia sp. BCC0405]|uniref:DUF11 domain-containing protein n=1 Tax=Burkholderia sp. BCC0405 TaxID=2676298 RepID=UPI00158C223C|nr:DUF11 domain-containing protein [Burkholderia sp. BCC0405]